MPIIFNEDEALKRTLSGIRVPQARGSGTLLNVPVRFGMPQDEFASLTFPVVIIEHVSIGRDPEREHRGRTTLDYAPEGGQPWWGPNDEDYLAGSASPYILEFPTPMNIDYEVTALAREKSHLVALIASYTAEDRLDPRFGSMYIPQDGTARRLEILGDTGIESDRDADGKRIFRAKYAVRVPTEIIPAEYPEIFRVDEINLDMTAVMIDLS